MAEDDRVERAGGVRSRGAGAKPARAPRKQGVKTPPPVALEYAEDVSSRVSGRSVPVRNGFIEKLDSASTEDPPLAVLLRGGQGGAVRLKLLLSMLWFAVRAPHDTSYPARGWAGLLGLDEYETNGARRIAAAIDWLEANNLLEVVRRPGMPSKVYLRDERATASPYVLPFTALEAKREAGEALGRDDYYVTLPAEFFTKGWIAILSAPAVAMLLVMVLEARYARRTRGLWHSPKQADDRFGLSQDTRSDGLQELERYGIVTKRVAPVAPGVFDMKRRRNIYDLHLEQLMVAPGQPRPSEELTPERLDELVEGDLATQPEAESTAAADGVAVVEPLPVKVAKPPRKAKPKVSK